MAAIAKDSGNMQRIPPAGVFKIDVMVELKRQSVNVGKGFCQFIVPAAQISRIRQGSAIAKEIARTLEAKAKRRPAIVTQRQCPAAQSRRERPFLALGELAQQSRSLQPRKSGAVFGEAPV